ncbi:amidohydrolase family protein [uncultured Clostridium sp.]|uniref:amidohydrolase family protein n=1 Tax=uncultured Clostridium sp. TaxID=59620 RepID=UPI00258F99C1|nr:amidohydrolase family protein [uncultured Clostridium sp.]
MILRAKYLITGDGRTCLQDQAVYLDKEGKIGWIGDAAEAAGRYPEETVKDYGEATILPGLFDMHVHFGYYYSQPDLDNYDDYMVAYYALEQAKQSLRLGITTVRDLSCPPNLMKQLRLAGQKGYVTVPRIIHADAGICMTGGHGHQDGVEEADSPWGVRAAIRRQLRAGADWIKILTSNRGDIPEFTQEELDAAVDEAHRQGVKIAVHSGTQPSIQMCIDAGFDTIEHGTFLTEAQARQMAEKGIAWTPTITAYTYLYEQTKQMIEAGVNMDNPITARAVHDQAFFKPAFEAYRDNFKKLYDTGVTVLAGSDMVLYKAPPLPIHQELGYMVDYGITPMEAIRTATYNAASVLGIENETGSLKEGLAGDLLIVKGDVSKNIRALDDVQEVYLAGKMVYTA